MKTEIEILQCRVIDHGLAGAGEEELLRDLCERLLETGVPVHRAVLGFDTLHPVVEGRVTTWSRSTGETLDAALAARASIASLNDQRTAKGLPVTEFGLALHVGELLYGNIGSWDRLDFTVIGPAVNEASRIEAMCGSLDQTVIVSSAFADTAPECRSRLVSLGRYALRGVARPQELFTLDPDALPG